MKFFNDSSFTEIDSFKFKSGYEKRIEKFRKLTDKDNQINQLNGAVQARDNHIIELNSAVEAKITILLNSTQLFKIKRDK